QPPGWDAGAIMLMNTSGGPLQVRDVSVSFETTTKDLWGHITIPRGGTAILTQTDPFNFNFDGSQLNGGTCTTPSTFKPVVHVTMGAGGKNSVMQDFVDQNQVLAAGGLNLSDCLPPSNEGLQW